MIKDIKLDNSLFFESIFNASPDAQIVVDKVYNILKVNNAFCDKTNINPAQAEGNHLKKIIGQVLFQEIFRPKIDTCFHTWTSINFSTKLQISGQYLGLNLILTPIHSNLPPFDSVLITAKDLTNSTTLNGHGAFSQEQKKSTLKGFMSFNKEQFVTKKNDSIRLKETEANISSLIENNRTLVWSVDENYRLTFLNSNFINLANDHYGIRLKTGMRLVDYVDEETKSYWKDKYEKVFKGRQLKLNYVHNLPEGKLYTELYLNPIISEGKVIGVNAFAIDISELKQQEQILLNLNTSLRQEIEVRKKIEKDLKFKNNELDTFIYKASHDLRGPIASLVGLYSAAKIEIEDPKAQEYLEYIHKTAQRMDQVLKALINLSEIKDRQVDISVANVSSLLNDILNVLNSRENNKPAKFEISVSEELVFNTDEGLLIVMLKNLLENALKYARHNQPTIIKVNVCINKDKYLKVTVVDNGMGMHHQIQDKVFNMFYKGNHLSTGSGLGLYMVKSAVDKLGGKVTLKSKENEGTKFTILLPELKLTEKAS